MKKKASGIMLEAFVVFYSFFTAFRNIQIAAASVLPSATGTAIHTPVMPKILDSRIAAGAITARPRIREMMKPKSARSMALKNPAKTILKHAAK